MATESTGGGWLLLLVQLPGSPSSARVALWRKLRSAGAAGILNGAWVLPHAAEHERFFEQLRNTVCRQGGRAFVLTVAWLAPDADAMIVARFRADRAREYDELAERCHAFLAELHKETRAGKFTFAELEENEQDLEKLVGWLAKIRARDFFPDDRRPRPEEMVQECRQALGAFSRAVYEAEEVQERTGGAGGPSGGAAGADSGAG